VSGETGRLWLQGDDRWQPGLFPSTPPLRSRCAHSARWLQSPPAKEYDADQPKGRGRQSAQLWELARHETAAFFGELSDRDRLARLLEPGKRRGGYRHTLGEIVADLKVAQTLLSSEMLFLLTYVAATRKFFRTTPAEVRRLLADAAGSHLLEFTETVEALEWRASGATTTFAPPPPTALPSQLPSEDADDAPEPNEAATPALRELSPGRVVPLDGVQHLRLLLQVTDDRDVEIDPVAFLLSKEGVVGTDSDMVFYGQPDHPTGAVTLAADGTDVSARGTVRTQLSASAL
jgi:TerD domain